MSNCTDSFIAKSGATTPTDTTNTVIMPPKSVNDVNVIMPPKSSDTKGKDIIMPPKYSKIEGIFDNKIGTTINFATQEDVNNYFEYAYRYAEETNEKGNTEFPKQKNGIIIGRSEERLVNDLKTEFGIDVTGAYHTLMDNDIRHVKNSHGESTNEKYPVTAEDQKKIPDIIKNYDDVLYVENNGKKGIYYVKRHNGVTYYLEAIINDGRTLANKQMIKVSTGTIPDVPGLREAINKKWNIDSVPDDSKIPQMYVQDVENNYVPDNNIPQQNTVVKEPILDVQDAQMYNIATSNLIRLAREKGLDLQTFYNETQNVNAYNLTAEDIRMVNAAFEKMFGSDVDNVAQGNFGILSKIANKYPVVNTTELTNNGTNDIINTDNVYYQRRGTDAEQQRRNNGDGEEQGRDVIEGSDTIREESNQFDFERRNGYETGGWPEVYGRVRGAVKKTTTKYIKHGSRAIMFTEYDNANAVKKFFKDVYNKYEKNNHQFWWLFLVRQMGLEPIRRLTHAPQTCLSAYSSTAAYSVLMTISNPETTVKTVKGRIVIDSILKCLLSY